MSTTASAHDIADALRHRPGHLTKWKLHKLLYYVQGWHLANFGFPAFDEPIEAWEDGPVISPVWVAEEHSHARDVQPIPTHVASTIDFVWARLGHISGDELRDRTHTEAPWVGAYDPNSRRNVITHAALTAWFEAEKRADDFGARHPDIFSFDPPVSDEIRAAIRSGLAER